jgi:hypothetical protein
MWAVTLLLLAGVAQAAIPNAMLRGMHSLPKVLVPEHSITSPNGTALPPLTTVYYFDQLIDHDNPGLGTFKQRYWMNWEFYEPGMSRGSRCALSDIDACAQGGPIILMTPGEANADGWFCCNRFVVFLSKYLISGYQGYTTNDTINGLIAQQQNGAAIIIEHRFFGLSNPYDNLTSQSLALLTIQQAIDDLVYFATTADLPMCGGDAVKPGQAPWILIGGSYAGALTSYTMVK